MSALHDKVSDGLKFGILVHERHIPLSVHNVRVNGYR
jgi:hypothetical protein